MKFIPLLLIIFSSHSGYSQKSVENDSAIRTSKTIIELEDAKTIFKEKKSDFWDKYSNGLIAAITVIVSLGISVWQAYNSHKHTKANIIAEARIEWIQKLRPHIGDLISEVSLFSTNFREFNINYIDSETKEIRTDLQEKEYKESEAELALQVYKITKTFDQVKLFLNPKEDRHKDFINSVEDFLYKSVVIDNLKIDNIENFEDDLILKAQIILKHAWLQANFGKKKAEKMIRKNDSKRRLT